MMNREDRRKYEKRIRNDKRAFKCPLCGKLALFYTTAELKPYEGTKETFDKDDFETALRCEVCKQIIHTGPEVTKLIPPGVYLPIPLDIFEYALRHPEEENDGES